MDTSILKVALDRCDDAAAWAYGSAFLDGIEHLGAEFIGPANGADAVVMAAYRKGQERFRSITSDRRHEKDLATELAFVITLLINAQTALERETA